MTPYRKFQLKTRGGMMSYCYVAISLALVVLSSSGCASLPRVSHVHIVVDKDGLPKPTGDQRKTPSDVAFRKEVSEWLDTVEAYIAAERHRGRIPKLMIYVHGGLNSYEQALKRIEEMVDSKHHLKGTDIYPIFIVWNAELFNALGDDLFAVRHGVREPWYFTWPTLPFVLFDHVLGSLIRTPVSLAYQARNFFKTWGGTQRSESYLPGERPRFFTCSIPTTPARVVMYPLVIGFGTGAWDMLKRRIDQMFAVEVDAWSEHKRKGAGRIFFGMLAKRIASWDTRNKEKPVELALVGHSMGAIVVNRVLREFPTIEFDRIIYMGAAASIDDFRETVVPYLVRHPQTQFYSFSLAIKNEDGEITYCGLLPSGSLLVWIDNLFEPGLYPGGKRVGWYENKRYIKVDLEGMDHEVCSRMTFLKVPGGVEDPLKHSEFDDDGKFQRMLELASPSWRESCEACDLYHPC